MLNNELTNMLTLGYDEMRSVVERFTPASVEEAELQQAELRRLEWLYEATMWHFENSVAIEQILEANKYEV